MYSHYDTDRWGTAAGITMIVIMAVLAVTLLAVVGTVAWAMTRAVRGDRDMPDSGPSPLQVLADRFARGDIDATEYRQRAIVLGAPDPGPDTRRSE